MSRVRVQFLAFISKLDGNWVAIQAVYTSFSSYPCEAPLSGPGYALGLGPFLHLLHHQTKQRYNPPQKSYQPVNLHRN